MVDRILKSKLPNRVTRVDNWVPSASDTIDAGHQLLGGVVAHQWPKAHHRTLLLHLQAAKRILCHGIYKAPSEECLHMLVVLPSLQSMNARDQLKRWIHSTNWTLVENALLSLWVQPPQ